VETTRKSRGGTREPLRSVQAIYRLPFSPLLCPNSIYRSVTRRRGKRERLFSRSGFLRDLVGHSDKSAQSLSFSSITRVVRASGAPRLGFHLLSTDISYRCRASPRERRESSLHRHTRNVSRTSLEQPMPLLPVHPYTPPPRPVPPSFPRNDTYRATGSNVTSGRDSR